MKIAGAVILLLVAFASGRFLSPTKIKTETKVVTVEKIVEKVVHSVTTITEKPDGTKETHIDTHSDTTAKSDTKEKDSKQEITKSNSTTNLSALIGINTYGISLSRNLLGPITFGPWVISNTSFQDLKAGISIGVNF